MASSRALCVLGLARLISSASSTWANTGPGWNTKASLPRSYTDTPVRSLGMQVGRELHARKLQAEAWRQRVGQRGLAHARHVLDQQVPAGQQAGDAVLYLMRFAHNHRVKLIQKRFDFVLCMHGVTLSEKQSDTTEDKTVSKTGYFTHRDCWKHEMGLGTRSARERLDAIEDRLLVTGPGRCLERFEAP